MEEILELPVHDFRMVAGSEHTNLIFDVSLPADRMPQQQAIRDRLEQTLLQREGKKYYTVITFDPESFNR